MRNGGEAAAALVWHDSLASTDKLPAIRTVASWQSRRKTTDLDMMRLDLARHLYGRYPVPAFLERCWLKIMEGRGKVTEKWVEGTAWYKAAASGLSVYKTCGVGILSRQECHLFLRAPEWATAREAIWMARLMNMGAPQSDAESIARGRFTASAAAFDRVPSDSWLSVARFLVSTPGLRGDRLDDVLDWVSVMIAADPQWSMKGRTEKTVTGASRDWHRMILRQKEWAKNNWTGYPIDPWSLTLGSFERGTLREWRIEQITTGKALAAEGAAMRHCVASYIQSASAGRRAIFSMSVEKNNWRRDRALTIELDPSFTVVQVKGYANRSPTMEEQAILTRWIADNGFGPGRY